MSHLLPAKPHTKQAGTVALSPAQQLNVKAVCVHGTGEKARTERFASDTLFGKLNDYLLSLRGLLEATSSFASGAQTESRTIKTPCKQAA